MKARQYKFRSKVWVYPGLAAWRFVNIPKEQSKGIMNLHQGFTAGFGSLPVNVTIGKTKWKTSIFPDKKNGIYMLPLKKEIRKKEYIKEGDTINFSINIIT